VLLRTTDVDMRQLTRAHHAIQEPAVREQLHGDGDVGVAPRHEPRPERHTFRSRTDARRHNVNLGLTLSPARPEGSEARTKGR
jgi:hypothetical protein